MDASAPPRGLRVTSSPVAGLRVTRRDVATPRATVIAIHGGLDRGGSFARLARRLDDVSLVTYDRRGYQGSRALGPGRLQDHAADLLALVDRARADGPVVAFGHSFGGLVALTAAVAEPRRLDAVIAYESPLPWVLTRPDASPAPHGDPARLAEGFFRRMVGTAAWERLSEPERQSRRDDGPALMADLTALHEVAPWRPEQIDTRTVYAYGDNERTPYYRALVRELATASPVVTSAELRGAGHGAHLSSPDDVARLIMTVVEETCVSE